MVVVLINVSIAIVCSKRYDRVRFLYPDFQKIETIRMQEHQQPEGQIHRRDVLKTAIGTLVASTAVAGAAVAQQAPGPFDLPSTTFDPKRLDIIHPWAFKTKLPIPLVPRPTFVGTYDELMKTGIKPFGPGDDTPICESFHGIAREWYETPDHWKMFGLDPHLISASFILMMIRMERSPKSAIGVDFQSSATKYRLLSFKRVLLTTP